LKISLCFSFLFSFVYFAQSDLFLASQFLYFKWSKKILLSFWLFR
jgi:hypothetical protein